jgi:tetratricopeptide (TPR) repeat protein
MTDTHAELETAQRYAAGSLNAADAAAFEDHMVGCEQCQTEVRLAVAVRATAAEVHKAHRSITRTLIGAGLAMAAGIALFVFLPRVDPKLAALGQFLNPPAYVGMAVRALPRNGDSLFADAMVNYVARRYDIAESGLQQALAAGVDSIPARFWLASAQLMSGNPRAAEATYARVIAAGDAASGYLPEAHLYRARALLQLGLGSEALVDLAAVDRACTERSECDSDRGAAAAALADSVTRVLRR